MANSLEKQIFEMNRIQFGMSQNSKTSYEPHELAAFSRKTIPNVRQPPIKVKKLDLFKMFHVPLRLQYKSSYRNLELCNRFVDSLGRIQGRHITGLEHYQHRAAERAVKLARHFGVMPYTYKKEFTMESVLKSSHEKPNE
ncbi:hypothetical protein ROZALSC1DRAFT_27243 [Rozella allomycis CSF55]|uniref:Small ribosomal subunit protein bS18m n=1 Tax=Rozella allomycis (strain CSF55) TaxID=988480 RepID=A0A075ARP2_ROZAC|nr:hypothetical protein O9G_001094 [Rozella allomycis CSF55]RKP21341.1 hypothetical protein ROZALSC1DRAFT_27243 [Rozella allomycis CSF55]|eukprot:EPZ31182.1 hypothetical protein O9G_001094 [Rozella allomycis CSF55]